MGSGGHGERYLVTYRPIVLTRPGRRAVKEHGLPPFVDGSCRREPDFESVYPSITALCRGSRFAPRLHPGDRVIYLTTKGSYLGRRERHWRLTAVLQVLHRFASHKQAASWYRERSLTPPSNCMVAGNPPLPIELTAGAAKKFGADSERALRLWDYSYRQRARENSVLVACTPRFLELWEPPAITESAMKHAFGRIPATQNPPAITEAQYQSLLEQAGIEGFPKD